MLQNKFIFFAQVVARVQIRVLSFECVNSI